MSARSPHAFTHRGSYNEPAVRLAAEQHGPISREQLVELGWSHTTVDRRVADWSLKVIWPGVFTFGQGVLTRDGWLMAAALACGPGARLAGRGSGAARGLMAAWSTIDVATPTKRGVELPGIRAHRLDLRPVELDTCRGLPVTSLARTALDVAALERPDRVAVLLDRALLDGHYDHTEMLELLEKRRGCRGVGVLRDAVAKLGDEGVVFRSRPERRARDLILAAGLPAPRVNAWFPTRAGHGYELDLWFPELRFDLEIDGPHHRMPHQRRKDELRDMDLRSFGVRVLRLPDTFVGEEPDAFVMAVASALW